jgi:predicted helicase
MQRTIAFYNSQVDAYHAIPKNERPDVEQFIDFDAEKISWARGTKQSLQRNKLGVFNEACIIKSMYRPFCKQWLYFDRQFNEMIYQMPKIFPNPDTENLVICVSGVGSNKDFSALISNILPDLEIVSKSQCFPLYIYEESTATEGLFSQNTSHWQRRDAINDDILRDYRAHYADSRIDKTAIFYYIYGVLHDSEYKTNYAADLKKMLPRIPYMPDFWQYSDMGKQLAYWHLNYETIEPYDLKEEWTCTPEMRHYRVEKMRYAKSGKSVDKSVLIYNEHLSLSGIPAAAHEYIVNGKSALDWLIDRYQITTDKASGIRNDPNEWLPDNPRYVIDLIKKVVRVSVETVGVIGK